MESVVTFLGAWRRFASRLSEDMANRRPNRELSLSDPGADTSVFDGDINDVVLEWLWVKDDVDPLDSSIAQVVQIPASKYSTGGRGGRRRDGAVMGGCSSLLVPSGGGVCWVLGVLH
jgi:hypothetical protein